MPGTIARPQTGPCRERRSGIRRRAVLHIEEGADRLTRSRYQVSEAQRSRPGSRSRGSALVHGCDVELRKTELPGDIHGRDLCLVCGPGIRPNREGPALRSGFLDEGRAQGLGVGVDEGPFVDPVAALGGDRDHQGLMRTARQRNLTGLRQLNLDPPLLLKRGRHHEKDEEYQQDVEERDQIDLRILMLAGPQFHDQRLEGSAWLRSSNASTSFMASFSMRITRRSTLPRRKGTGINQGIRSV